MQLISQTSPSIQKSKQFAWKTETQVYSVTPKTANSAVSVADVRLRKPKQTGGIISKCALRHSGQVIHVAYRLVISSCANQNHRLYVRVRGCVSILLLDADPHGHIRDHIKTMTMTLCSREDQKPANVHSAFKSRASTHTFWKSMPVDTEQNLPNVHMYWNNIR